MFRFALFFSLILIFVATFSLPAQTTDDATRVLDNQTGFGARALGMGGAYSGVADDYSAIYWNPAGLAQMRKMEFWTEFSNINFDNNLTYRNNLSTASNNATKFNSIGIVFPVPTYRGSLVFALGYQKLRDFEYANNFSGLSAIFSDEAKTFLPSVEDTVTGAVYDFWDREVKKEEFITDEGSVNQWSAAGAVDISPNISLGATINYWSGKSDYQLDFTQADVLNRFETYPGNFNDYQESRAIASRYSSFSLKLGGLFHLGRYARLGMTIDLPQTITVDEDYSLFSSVSFDDGDIIDLDDISESSQYDIKVPLRISGGASFAAGPALISGGIDYVDWTQFKFNTDFLKDQNRYFKTDYRGTLKWHVGGEVGLPFYDSQLRAGYVYDPNPLKDQPGETDRKYITAGFGVLIDKVFKIDFAYLRGGWKQTTFDELAPAGTAEDVTLQKLLFTLSYRF